MTDDVEARCDLLDAYESLRTLIIDNIEEGEKGYTLSMDIIRTRKMWNLMDKMRKALATKTGETK